GRSFRLSWQTRLLSSSRRSLAPAVGQHIYPLSLHDALPICVGEQDQEGVRRPVQDEGRAGEAGVARRAPAREVPHEPPLVQGERSEEQRLNSSHVKISYAVFCLKKKEWNVYPIALLWYTMSP